jgi:hypothetical protein
LARTEPDSARQLLADLVAASPARPEARQLLAMLSSVNRQ